MDDAQTGVGLTEKGSEVILEPGNTRGGCWLLSRFFFFLLHSNSLGVVLYLYMISARIVGGYKKTETEQETGTGKVRADARTRNEPNSNKIIRIVIPYMFTVLYGFESTLKCVILFDPHNS